MVKLRFRCTPQEFEDAQEAVKKAMEKFSHHRTTCVNKKTQTIEIDGNPPHGFIHEIIAGGFNIVEEI